MSEALAALRERYELVVIDTAPLGDTITLQSPATLRVTHPALAGAGFLFPHASTSATDRGRGLRGQPSVPTSSGHC